MPTRNEFKLFEEIIKISEAKIWEEAKNEWYCVLIEIAPDDNKCLCGHSPIRELCWLRNTKNGLPALVGNCCVKKFFREDIQRAVDCFKRAILDHNTNLNEAACKWSLEQGWITRGEWFFCSNIAGKSDNQLTAEQQQRRHDINVRVAECWRESVRTFYGVKEE